MSKAIELIVAERHRQITEEGWSPQHDDTRDRGELSQAAAVYADASGAIVRGASASDLHILTDTDDYGPIYVGSYVGFDGSPSWPWDDRQLKLSDDPIRNLVKAGALIVAEIERLQRADGSSNPKGS
jgi:hypothetical protein